MGKCYVLMDQISLCLQARKCFNKYTHALVDAMQTANAREGVFCSCFTANGSHAPFEFLNRQLSICTCKETPKIQELLLCHLKYFDLGLDACVVHDSLVVLLFVQHPRAV